jgi:hypothetical protein
VTKIQELQDQAARAERLARGMIDAITVERLIAFAAECRQKIQAELLSRYPRYPHVTIDDVL